MFTVYILGLFPAEIAQFFLKGIFKRGVEQGRFAFNVVDLRQFGIGKQCKVDDYPFGHQTGMLLRADVLYKAVTSIKEYHRYQLVYPCPKGPILTQSMASNWASETQGLIIIPGYYKGIDERLFDLLPINRVSLGNFVLSSGEVPALAIVESVVRLIPGVIGNKDSMSDDSVMGGLLENPHYTQPREFMSHAVPDVIVSGNHPKRIQWERQQALQQTLFSKPELLLQTTITETDQQLMKNIMVSCADQGT